MSAATTMAGALPSNCVRCRVFRTLCPQSYGGPRPHSQLPGTDSSICPQPYSSDPHREATDLEQEQRIRAYLQIQPFDATARERFTQWLALRAQDGLGPQDL